MAKLMAGMLSNRTEDHALHKRCTADSFLLCSCTDRSNGMWHSAMQLQLTANCLFAVYRSASSCGAALN